MTRFTISKSYFQEDEQMCLCDQNGCNEHHCDTKMCDCPFADPDHCIKVDPDGELIF